MLARDEFLRIKVFEVKAQGSVPANVAGKQAATSDSAKGESSNGFFADSIEELRKVTTPTRQEATQATMVTLVIVVFVAFCLFFMDLIFSKVTEALMS